MLGTIIQLLIACNVICMFEQCEATTISFFSEILPGGYVRIT